MNETNEMSGSDPMSGSAMGGQDWEPTTVGELLARLPEPDDPVAVLEVALLAAWRPDVLAGSGALPGCALREPAGTPPRAPPRLAVPRRLPADLSPAADFYARRRLPALAMVRADAPARPRLTPTPDPPVLVMTAPVEAVAAPPRRGEGGAARPGVAVGLDGTPPSAMVDRTFASTPSGGAGRLAVTGVDGIAVLDGLFVPPRARRRGEASAMVRALAGAAGTLGARTMALEVERDNAPAVACYLALGFQTHHEHLYATLGAPA